MHELRELGVAIAIDDFGTEYSSLSRLKTLPVDRLKLDMMFVHGIGKDPRDEAVAKTILRLANDLSLHTLAEGVETREQELFLLQHGCEEIQGYLYYRPLTVEDARVLLENTLQAQKEAEPMGPAKTQVGSAKIIAFRG